LAADVLSLLEAVDDSQVRAPVVEAVSVDVVALAEISTFKSEKGPMKQHDAACRPAPAIALAPGDVAM
jgi:hypothetical protein